MYIQFISGRPGTGKTHRCLEMIKEKLDGDADLYYLIPEQYSLQAEKLLLTLDKRVITRVQALSFNRLAYRLFATLGGAPGKLLDDVGKGLLVRKVLSECDLSFYKNMTDRQGFVDNLARMLTEFNQHNVTAEDLRLRVPDSDTVLAAKLNDLALVMEKYREAVRARYLLTDDMLDVLCARLEQTHVLKGSYFWIDGFYGFTPQECRVLSCIMQAAGKTVFTLTIREGDSLCRPAAGTLDRLTRLAKQTSATIEPTIMLTKNHRANHDALDFFSVYFHPSQPVRKIFPQQEQNGYRRLVASEAIEKLPKQFPIAEQSAIHITHAADKYACVYEAARQVWEWVSEKNYRFRDIAILCGDRAGYLPILQSAFDRCRIPLFMDAVSSILSHSLTELIRAALDIIVRDWSYVSVFRFLKTRLTDLTEDSVDILENYVLARGIKSYRWRYPFTDEKAEAIRLKVLEAMADFDKLRSSSTDTVKGFSRRIVDMLVRLRVPEELARLSDACLNENDTDTAKQYSQVWGIVCEVMDKLVEILGDEKMTLKTYARILDAGLSQADLGRIPPMIDQVFVGDINRSRFPQVKAMLVLGANDNAFPPLPRGEGLLTDRERMMLKHTDLSLANDNNRQWEEDMYALYCALCQPSEALVLLYANAETGGSKPLRPAPVLKKIKEMFPSIQERPAPDFSEYGILPIPETLLNTLSPEIARRLYGSTVVTAASRLEQYAACPFAYYVTYNLKAKERKIYQVRHTDLGMLFHEVLSLFSQHLTDNKLEWGSLSYSEIESKAGQLAEKVLSDDDHVLRSTARNQYVLEKAKRICVTSLWALCEHVKRGSFTPAASELSFAPNSPLTSLEIWLGSERRMVLTGRIDRVDIYRADDGSHYVKIIDYKSGRKKFDLSEVLLGTQLQLILYMNALLKNAALLFGKDTAHIEARPGGVFYFHIDDPLLSVDEPLSTSEKEVLLLKAFRMSGLVLADENAVVGMDNALKEGGDSLIIPVTINKNGAFGKASSVQDLDGFEQLGKEVEGKIKELGTKMTEGVIEAVPLVKGQYSACEYCRYGGICGVK